MAGDEGYVEVADGVRLFFRSIGSGDAVIIPLACWTEEFDVLADRRRVIFYDPRNRGGSTAVALERISFQNDIDDLDAVRSLFGLNRVSLIGWSYFAAVVARYAMDHPAAVSRFVMVCGPPIRRLPHADVINRMMMERVEAVAPGLLRELHISTPPDPHVMHRFWNVLKEVRTGRRAGAMRSHPQRYDNERPEKVGAVFTRALQTQGDWDWRDDARRAISPAMCVFGTADLMPEQAVEEWAEHLPDCRILKLDGVGHHPAVEDPARFFPALDVFLSGRWPDNASSRLI